MKKTILLLTFAFCSCLTARAQTAPAPVVTILKPVKAIPADTNTKALKDSSDKNDELKAQLAAANNHISQLMQVIQELNAQRNLCATQYLDAQAKFELDEKQIAQMQAAVSPPKP